jgi:hypothetical protein
MTELGRGLINTQPDADSCQFDEGEVVCCEFVVAGGDTPTLLDLVEEPLDEITRAIQVRAKANWLLSIALWRNVGHAPCCLTSALIQSASYPRSASNIDWGCNPANSSGQSRLS